MLRPDRLLSTTPDRDGGGMGVGAAMAPPVQEDAEGLGTAGKCAITGSPTRGAWVDDEGVDDGMRELTAWVNRWTTLLAV